MTDQLKSKIDELSEDRAQLLAMLTSMVEGVMVLDCRGRVLQVNPALERMFDVTRIEARGHPCSDVFRHPQLDTLVSTVLTKRMNEEDEILLHPNGRCLHIEASVTACDRENEACAVLVFHDVTELRRLENIRKDFVANVSHELRTPLTSIKGYIEALLDGAKDDPDISTKFLDIISSKATAESDSGRPPPAVKDRIRTGPVQTRTASGSEGHRTNAGDDQTLSRQERAPARLLRGRRSAAVLGDEDRLTQVMSNLLDNAVKYTPERGTITVAAHPVSDDADSPRWSRLWN
jgi:PAS domain S-box